MSLFQDISPEWLASLKVGDVVCCPTSSSRWEPTIMRTLKIVKLTPSQIVMGVGRYEVRAYRKDGKIIGAYSYHIEPWTEKLATEYAEYKDRVLCSNAIVGFSPKTAPIEQVRAVLAALTQPVKEEGQ
jgi:hypothetical protein